MVVNSVNFIITASVLIIVHIQIIDLMFSRGVGQIKRIDVLIIFLSFIVVQFRFVVLGNQADLGIYCDEFVENTKTHCVCSVNRTSGDAKCQSRGEGILTTISIIITDDVNKTDQNSAAHLCNFRLSALFEVPNTDGSCVSGNGEAGVQVNSDDARRKSIYLLKASFRVSNTDYLRKYVTCLAKCKGGDPSPAILRRNTTGILITFGKTTGHVTPTKVSDPFEAGIIAGIVIGSVCGLLLLLALIGYFAVRYQRKMAWTVSPPTKRVCYDGPLPVQLPRVPPPKNRASTALRNLPVASSIDAPGPSSMAPLPMQGESESNKVDLYPAVRRISTSTDVDETSENTTAD